MSVKTTNQHMIKEIPLIKRFPFPFQKDSYRYSNNLRPLESGKLADITPEYFEEIDKKRQILLNHHERAFQSLEHSIDGQWEVLEFLIDELAIIYPEYFSVIKNGHEWTFENKLLDEKHTFTFGDLSTLPYEPLDFIGRHVQEDLIFMGQRDGDLYMDAGQLCFPANWSIAFDIGMTYTEFHSPVPVFFDSGLAKKVLNFLLRIEAGKPWTRLNWTLTVEPILDTFPENFDEWGPKKEKVTSENAGQLVHLRVEDQRLFRMPRSNGILFSIHTHLISLDELKKNEDWLKRFFRVLKDLPDYMAEYKGFSLYKGEIIRYLEKSLTD
ncbi:MULTISPECIES: heme-dependent oxidative N-demethylase family protein [unclassified Aeribacillus]|uniref:heme-dependent oxidative N-demethylase family protein n=1 Tax=unclassified Aeribacillus TaxID=2640495 RepID=UPI0030CD7AE6